MRDIPKPPKPPECRRIKGCMLTLLIGLGLIFTLALLTGCGSPGSGGGLPLDGQIEISCMDLNYSASEACNGIQEGQNEPQKAPMAMMPPRAIYNAGIINTGTNIWAQAEVINRTQYSAAVYFYTEFNKGGVYSGSSAQSYRMDMAPGDILDTGYGSNPCPDTGPCALDGYYEYVTYVYNASHLQAGTSQHGNPAIDEVLAMGTLMFTLTENP